MEEMHVHLSKMRLALVNPRGSILLHDNSRPHVVKTTLHMFIDLQYKTLPHSPYSPNLSSTGYHFLKNIRTFLRHQKSPFKGKVGTPFENFSASKPLRLYCICINNLVNRWQKYRESQNWCNENDLIVRQAQWRSFGTRFVKMHPLS